MSALQKAGGGVRRRFLVAALLLVALAFAFAITASGAHAATWGFANNNIDQYWETVDGQGPTDADHDFWALTNQSALGRAQYQRFLITWDAAGTYDTTTDQCVTPISSGDNGQNLSITGLINALAAAEAGGFTPVIAIGNDNGGWDAQGGTNGYVWPAGANIPGNPNDWDMFCGAEELALTLGSSGVLNSNTYFESYNEPQSSGLTGDDCFFWNEPPALENDADCAARYYADVVSGLAWGHFPAYTTNVIAGAFTAADNASYTPGLSCQNQTGFDAQYICFIENGDPNGGIPPDGTNGLGANDNPLSSYEGYVHNWSFHDYDDLNASIWCYPGGPAGGCVTQDLSNMENLLSNSAAPYQSNLWMTESGCRYNGGPCSGLTPDQIGNEAYDWVDMAEDNPNLKIFWYEYFPDSGFDSALEWADGWAREDLCVIGSAGASQYSWNGIDCSNT